MDLRDYVIYLQVESWAWANDAQTAKWYIRGRRAHEIQRRSAEQSARARRAYDRFRRYRDD